MRLTDDPVDTQYLDRALAGEMIHLFPWLDLQAGHGLARDKVVAEMLEWLGRHDEDRALAIVCEIVSREATRREFQLFEAAVAQRPDAVSRVKAVRFDVFSRSLV